MTSRSGVSPRGRPGGLHLEQQVEVGGEEDRDRRPALGHLAPELVGAEAVDDRQAAPRVQRHRLVGQGADGVGQRRGQEDVVVRADAVAVGEGLAAAVERAARQHHALGPAGAARRVEDRDGRVLVVPGRVGRVGALGDRQRREPGAPSAVRSSRGHSSRRASSVAATGSSAIRIPASECSIWKASSSKVSPPSRGTCTAPTRCRASCSGTVSGRLESPTSTRTPGPAPSAASPRASSRTAASVSAKVRVRPSQRRKGRSGVAATRRLQRSRPVGWTAPS